MQCTVDTRGYNGIFDLKVYSTAADPTKFGPDPRINVGKDELQAGVKGMSQGSSPWGRSSTKSKVHLFQVVALVNNTIVGESLPFVLHREASLDPAFEDRFVAALEVVQGEISNRISQRWQQIRGTIGQRVQPERDELPRWVGNPLVSSRPPMVLFFSF